MELNVKNLAIVNHGYENNIKIDIYATRFKMGFSRYTYLTGITAIYLCLGKFLNTYSNIKMSLVLFCYTYVGSYVLTYILINIIWLVSIFYFGFEF